MCRNFRNTFAQACKKNLKKKEIVQGNIGIILRGVALRAGLAEPLKL